MKHNFKLNNSSTARDPRCTENKTNKYERDRGRRLDDRQFAPPLARRLIGNNSAILPLCSNPGTPGWVGLPDDRQFPVARRLFYFTKRREV
jgi:hypothetical protein